MISRQPVVSLKVGFLKRCLCTVRNLDLLFEMFAKLDSIFCSCLFIWGPHLLKIKRLQLSFILGWNNWREHKNWIVFVRPLLFLSHPKPRIRVIACVKRLLSKRSKLSGLLLIIAIISSHKIQPWNILNVVFMVFTEKLLVNQHISPLCMLVVKPLLFLKELFSAININIHSTSLNYRCSS